jgi:hypothetical protein
MYVCMYVCMYDLTHILMPPFPIPPPLTQTHTKSLIPLHPPLLTHTLTLSSPPPPPPLLTHTLKPPPPPSLHTHIHSITHIPPPPSLCTHTYIQSHISPIALSLRTHIHSITHIPCISLPIGKASTLAQGKAIVLERGGDPDDFDDDELRATTGVNFGTLHGAAGGMLLYVCINICIFDVCVYVLYFKLYYVVCYNWLSWLLLFLN